MTILLGRLLKWLARHALIFLLVLIALVVLAKAYEAYRAVPALRSEVAALERQEALLEVRAREEREAAAAASARLAGLELEALRRRLAEVRAQIAEAGPGRSRAGFAVDVVRGDSGAIAERLGQGFRLQLLRHEEAAIIARMRMIEGSGRAAGLAEFVRRSDARALEIERRIAEIERRHPILSKAEAVPILQDLHGPWTELRALRRELREVRERRARAAAAGQAAQAELASAAAEYRRRQQAIAQAMPPTAELRREIERKRSALSEHWATRTWSAVRPVVGWALWIVLLLILVPPAVKAFWFFVVAPWAARLRPIVVAPGLGNRAGWLRPRPGGGDDPLPGSGVSRRLLLEPGDELLIKPEYLQSSMNRATIDSALVLSWSIPVGSLATGMVGLTRIRVFDPQTATLSATGDLFDEVAIIHVPEGSGLVFKPSHLVGVLHPADRPACIRRVWRLGHASAWLTLQLRFLVFEGPCALIVRGARGVALERAVDGRRIAGAATMGWSPGLRYSVRRSETFLAYLTGKQSLFNDGFEGEGYIVYEETPQSRGRGGVFGRGLEGLGDGLLKVLGL